MDGGGDPHVHVAAHRVQRFGVGGKQKLSRQQCLCVAASRRDADARTGLYVRRLASQLQALFEAVASAFLDCYPAAGLYFVLRTEPQPCSACHRHRRRDVPDQRPRQDRVDRIPCQGVDAASRPARQLQGTWHQGDAADTCHRGFDLP